jgi:hypothetical protein
MNAPIAIANPRFGNLLDPGVQFGLLTAAMPVMIAGSASPQYSASTPDADFPFPSHLIYQFPLAGRP